MTLPIQRLIEAASIRGLSESNGIILSIDGPLGVRINVTVSHQEPITIVAPMDLIWIKPDTGDVLRRVSRAQSQTHSHTWQLADESNFWQQQIWDEPRPNDQDFQELNRNIGNTHLLKAEDIGAISTDGAQMLGQFRPRVLDPAKSETYAAEEAVPRSFIETLTLAAQGLAASVYQQLNSVRSSLTNARNRLVIVEQKLQDIEIGEGTPRYKHDQLEPSLEWRITHSLNTLDVTVEVRNSDGLLMVPDIQQPIDADNILLTFAEPRTGKVLILGLR